MRMVWARINDKFVLILLFLAAAVNAAAPDIQVVYPKRFDPIGAADSTFILGSVTPGSSLTINGERVEVHPDGGFIAFLPLTPGNFLFKLLAVNDADSARLNWPVVAPLPRRSFAYDSLRLVDLTGISQSALLAAGDRLVVECQGTPGCAAYFSIPGYADSIPMAELLPRLQPYWGETVFGVGAVPESLKIRGYYQGFLNIGDKRLQDSSRIYYHLQPPGIQNIIDYLKVTRADLIDYDCLKLLRFDEYKTIDSSDFHVWINSEIYPRMVEFVDSVQIMRVGPRKGYLSIFQPEGVTALAVGAQDDWIKLSLSQTQVGWVKRESVKFMSSGYPPNISYLKAVRTMSSPDHLTVELPLERKHPFRVEEEDAQTISIFLYGVISDTDWIRYDFNDKDLSLVTWKQVEPELYQLKLHFGRPFWGYDAFYEGSTLRWRIEKMPENIKSLKEKIVIIDPGHSPDPGAIGPTGLTEAEANLNIALALRKELAKKGAVAVMTRDDMSPLPLYDRPEIARTNDADLFISIHNNALPDGVNPFENNGVSTYYYHPHSIALARAIQEELVKRLDLPDHGLYHGNLAVNRPTQYPSVLVECAFIILPDQEALLKTKRFQKKVAMAVRKGVEQFLKESGRYR
ncbi:MAG: N-acetylmuramoyl-L-alanine amidase [Candidatus Zixiibacteriota bacterium]|nr:MAG: N-acetylmuramoyl-L-alanine amidase [candidate division Zixibacteria bacterium]